MAKALSENMEIGKLKQIALKPPSSSSDPLDPILKALDAIAAYGVVAIHALIEIGDEALEPSIQSHALELIGIIRGTTT
jgi:hypothetical protein